LPRKTIAQKDIGPERQLPRRKTFAQMIIPQRDICPDDNSPERHLPRKTIGQMTFE
jgi:hypothetical protein